MLENLAEMLITHHLDGRWRAPLSQRMRDVRGRGGVLLGRLVEAEAPDIDRALAAARAVAPGLGAMAGSGRAALAARFLEEWSVRADWVEAARRREGFSGGLAPVAVDLPDPARTGAPLALLAAVVAPPGLLAGAVAAGLRAGRPVLLKPAPRAPFTALVLAEALTAAGPPPGTLALLQGGGAGTGAALRARVEAVLLGKPARPALAGVSALA